MNEAGRSFAFWVRLTRGRGAAERGQATLEYIGALVASSVIVALVVAAVALPGPRDATLTGMKRAVCTVTGGTDCGAASGSGQPTGSDRPAPSADGQKPDGKKPDEGCHGFLGCTWGGIKQVGSGVYNVGKGAVDDVVGIYDLVKDPSQIVDAGKYIWDHPWDAAKSLVWDQDSQDMWNRGDYGGSVGRTIWNVGSWFIPGVDVGRGASKIGKFGKLGKLAEDAGKLGKAAKLADDAAGLAKKTEEAAKAGHYSEAEDLARQTRKKADEAEAEARSKGCPIAVGVPGRVRTLYAAGRPGGGGGRLGAASPVVVSPVMLLAEDGCDKETEAAKKADQQADDAEATVVNNGYGKLIKVSKEDPAADALAEKLGGESRVRFENGPDNEFDVVSPEYVGQTKPANFKINKDFREQAKTTFEVAKGTGRTPYFHFEGPPDRDVLRALQRYAERYGVEPVIDTVPLGGP